MERNRIYRMDCLDGLRRLPDCSVDVIITSPPYNKCGLNGYHKPNNKAKFAFTIDYGGDVDADNMPEGAYQDWQLEVLRECLRVLRDDGSMFYVHKNRINQDTGGIVSPYEWLLRSGFVIRQEIVWDRISTHIVNRCRYLPTSERIYWLTKGKKPRFDRSLDSVQKTEVWRMGFERNNAHPAPFPIELPDAILDCIEGEGLLVLDPFMGSGTVAVSARRHGMDYIGFEKYQQYVDMAERRMKKSF